MAPTSYSPKPLSRLFVPALLGVLSLASVANAEVIFSDNFGTSPTPGTINDFGYYTRANSGASWTIQTAPKTGSSMAGNYLETGGSTANGYTIKQWVSSPVTLSAVGDSISVSFDMDNRGAFNATANLAMSVILYNSSYTQTANSITGVNPFLGKVSGYGYAHVTTSVDSVNSTTAGIYRYTDFDAAASLGGTPPAPVSVPSAIYDQSVHTLTFSITKAEAGATFTFYDGASVVYSYTDPTATNLTFNTLSLRLPGVATGGVWIDNISVTTSMIPEASSLGLFLGAGALAAAGTSRRRRR